MKKLFSFVKTLFLARRNKKTPDRHEAVTALALTMGTDYRTADALVITEK